MKHIPGIIALLCLAGTAHAQIVTSLPIDTARQRVKGKHTLSVGSGGICYENGKPDSMLRPFEVQFGMLDLGINSLIDNTDYSNPPFNPTFAASNDFLRVDAAHHNADLFSLRQSKSVNVNIYPVMLKMRLRSTARQRFSLATGLGLQFYNFRFTKPITYHADPTPYVALDTVAFSKNKLALDYLMIPLMLNGKTKLGTTGHSSWLTYGVGVSAGYLLSSRTKQISDERGKEKNHDPFNLRKTNFCINGELGLDGYIRLYASYQLTSLHKDNLDQHPFSIGVRFLGL
jgi:hypothetical protein